MNSLLEIKNLSKTYISLTDEVKVLDSISFNINKGEFISLVGKSGCGKSTILNILAGLDKDYKGEVIGMDNISIGYMMQSDSLFPWLTVLENSCLLLKIKNIYNEENIKYVKYLINKYGLKEFENTKTSNLSGGQRQRVALIRTIAIKPDLVLLDEAFSALDYVSRLNVSKDVSSMLKEENITVLMVTHDIREAINLSSKVIVLSNRPAKVKNIYTIDDKSKYHDLIWKDINDE